MRLNVYYHTCIVLKSQSNSIHSPLLPPVPSRQPDTTLAVPLKPIKDVSVVLMIKVGACVCPRGRGSELIWHAADCGSHLC